MNYAASSARDWLKGSFTALVTPFKDGAVDFDAFDRLLERQLAGGTHGVVPAGTTGEGSTLTVEEQIAIIRRCVSVVAGRVPVIAGVGANDTPTALRLAKAAAEAGADGLLAATGYYNRPSQAGLIAHYTKLAEATDLPIVLYNVPARTASDISVDTMGVLAENPRIVALKDATSVLARVARQRLSCGSDFVQLSGEDCTAVGFNAMGGQGCISVTANVVPDLCAQMQSACLDGRWDEAVALQDRLTPLHDALFADTSPGPVKYALSCLGLIANELRLPLVPASDEARAAVDAALSGLDLI
ncbi:4-hydroxy-tetrahydrodipicolinate synthase [Parvularcula sp. LCG005]|uniref:4-hydroxy-tetrahydrodipicolinate synthase n=1 Tax=Parvularcula sp. LCG005 TaxID=3078805 RepID=UPI002942108D|nr:4-hydroxy-tetrahydrodipicolinate synthase [Parvularcula sp. LCG005]WOI52361.1 4-hydroxy-tetrahydrodipicolinate synthase [Parvularcula sp. LCG005]